MAPEREEPIWLSAAVVDAIHTEQLRQHGGGHGVRDHRLVESGLAGPVHKWHFGEDDLCALAAAHGFGLAQNHGFVDGNKRTAFMALYTFLGLNGSELEAEEPEVVQVMLGVADGSVSEESLAAWLRRHVVPWSD